MSNIYYCTITERVSDVTIVSQKEYFISTEARDRFIADYNKYLYREGECFISKTGEANFNKAGVLVTI